MPGPTLQTYNRRRAHGGAHRRPVSTTTVVAGACALALVLAACAWAVVSAMAPRAGANAGAGAGATPPGAGASVATASAAATGSASVAATSSAASTAAEATSSGPATITVAAVGDMIFDRRVQALIKARGGEAPLSKVAKRLAEADLTVGNLESTLSKRTSDEASKDVTLLGDPRAIAGLTASGFDVVSIANNHVLDYGPKALADSIRTLDAAGIKHAGAGANRAEAWKPAVVETGDASTAYLAFSFIVPAGFVAQPNRAGLASGRWDIGAIERAIKKAKRTHDYVLVSFHWGVEYKDNANAEQVAVAHRAIDAGADMVLAHHPHVIQGVELYKRGVIAYSLGDFVFDHYSRKTGESFILGAKLGPNGVSDVTVTPTYLDTYGRPSVVKGAAAKAILTRLKKISKAHHTTIAIDGDTATVTR